MLGTKANPPIVVLGAKFTQTPFRGEPPWPNTLKRKIAVSSPPVPLMLIKGVSESIKEIVCAVSDFTARSAAPLRTTLLNVVDALMASIPATPAHPWDVYVATALPLTEVTVLPPVITALPAEIQGDVKVMFIGSETKSPLELTI